MSFFIQGAEKSRKAFSQTITQSSIILIFSMLGL